MRKPFKDIRPVLDQRVFTVLRETPGGLDFSQAGSDFGCIGDYG
jgi:hypothetical protein